MKITDEDKIALADLNMPLKIAIIFSYILGILFILAFIIGFIGGVLGV